MVLMLAAVLGHCSGCTEGDDPAPAEAKKKTTVDIGEFKEREGEETVSSKVTITNPITGALEAYEPLKQRTAELAIEHSVRLYQAEHGHFPKNHDEFMTQIIQRNSIKLPKLSGGKRYEYDVENHRLMVVQEIQKEQ